MGEAAVWSLFLPRLGAGEKEVWSSRVEHSVRVQRVRLEDQHETVAGNIPRKQLGLKVPFCRESKVRHQSHHLDRLRYLSDCTPTPPLTQNKS